MWLYLFASLFGSVLAGLAFFEGTRRADKLLKQHRRDLRQKYRAFKKQQEADEA